MRNLTRHSHRTLEGSITAVLGVGALVGVIGNATYEWLHVVMGWDEGWIALGTVALLLLGLIPITYAVRYLLAQLHTSRGLSLTAEGRVRPAPALIVLVSPPAKDQPVTSLVAAAALKYHATVQADGSTVLRRCWLIASPQAHDCALELKQMYDPGVRCTVINIPNSESAAATFDAMNQIYREAKAERLRPSDIIADCTGGTKPMSAGMALVVAAAQERILEYIPTAYDAQGRPDRSVQLAPLLVSIEFFANNEEE